jgi:amino-acid N-acetyltransferase
MKVTDLRAILTYVPRYRDKVFVIAVDGEVLAEEAFSNLLLDIAVLWSLGIRIVLVHGASFQIRQFAALTGRDVSNADGTGPTDAPTLDVALTAANRLTHEVMEALTSTDIRSIYPNAVIAHPAGILGGVDQLFTGKVERVDDELLRKVLADGMIPVIPPLGFDGAGRTYRVNSDAIAYEVAKALGATKLIYVTAADKLTRDGETVAQLSVAEAEEFAKATREQMSAALRAKLEYSVRACREGGVNRVHFVNGKIDEALLGEVFLNEGTGTMIYANEYQAIRPAMRKDVRAIQMLIKRGVDSEELVRRSRTQILAQLADYHVFEMDRNIVACVALHEYPEAVAGELACLYVAAPHENAGIGRKMMAFTEKLARQKGFTRLFALSTQSFAYLEQKGGFRLAAPDELPASRRERWEQSGRNSRVLVKEL